MKLLAIDVHYRDTFAKSVSIEFEHWADPIPVKTNEVILHDIEEYVPGEFYKRELPCILKVLECSDLEQTSAIIIDGYITLDDNGKAGLGLYLYHKLDCKIPVIGVAKTRFANNNKFVREVFRGVSKNPLYITSIGCDLDWAAEKVKNMAGAYRMPDLLKFLDRMSKE